jgi:hypothetical protein
VKHARGYFKESPQLFPTQPKVIGLNIDIALFGDQKSPSLSFVFTEDIVR